jgi:hypothetical protein
LDGNPNLACLVATYLRAAGMPCILSGRSERIEPCLKAALDYVNIKNFCCSSLLALKLWPHLVNF